MKRDAVGGAPRTPSDAAQAPHLSAEVLQRVADGAITPLADGPSLEHVRGCAPCQNEIEALRQVAAALALQSVPPDGLRARVVARRAAGDRVLLPHVDADRSEADDEVESVGPGRHATRDDGVAGHVVDTETAPRATDDISPRAEPRRVRHASRVWSLSVMGAAAAALLLAAVYGPARQDGAPSAGAKPPAEARTAPAAPRSISPATPSVPNVGAAEPRAGATSGPSRADTRRSAPSLSVDGPAALGPSGSAAPSARRETPNAARVARVTETASSVRVALSAAADTLTDGQAQALDVAARALAGDPALRADIRYVDPAFDRQSESWHLAQRVADYLALRGVATERVTLVRVQAVSRAELDARLDVVELVVERP